MLNPQLIRAESLVSECALAEHLTQRRPEFITGYAYVEVTVSRLERLVRNYIRTRRPHWPGHVPGREQFRISRQPGKDRRAKLRRLDHHSAPGLLAPEEPREHRGDVHHRAVPVEVRGCARPFWNAAVVARNAHETAHRLRDPFMTEHSHPWAVAPESRRLHVDDPRIDPAHHLVTEPQPLHDRGTAEILDQRVGFGDQAFGARESISGFEIHDHAELGEVVADKGRSGIADHRCYPAHQIAARLLDLDYGRAEHPEIRRCDRTHCRLPKVERQDPVERARRLVE